ncbi:MAG: hypothetical protein IH862_00855 [Chloroflexi bacterium]|nr:hypothetical protein [Chloroflexota bacterium]
MGGTAREWTAIIPSDVVPGSEMQLRVVMTKFGGPAVRIGYEVLLEPEE